MQHEFSAGGVVYIKENDKTLILVCKHALLGHWGFPKGHIGDTIAGETKEQAALREVYEETGVTAEIIQELTPIEYIYTREEQKRKKTVFFFIMKFLSGDISTHDHEMSEVLWISEQDIADTLTYEGDKSVWNEANSYIRGIAY